MPKSINVETGRTIGTLKILEVRPSGAAELAVCQCTCSRIVGYLKSEIADGRRVSCAECTEKKVLSSLEPGDFAEMLLNLHRVPRGYSVLVISKAPGELVIEYMGRDFRCRPNDVRGVGIRI